MNLICIKCKVEKDLESFSKNKSKSNGVNKICKVCHSLYRRQHYIDNREKEIIQVKLYQSLNENKRIYIKEDIKSKRFSQKAGRTIKTNCPTCNCEVFITKKQKENNYIKYCSMSCRSVNNKSSYYIYLKGVEKRSIRYSKDFDLSEEFLKNLLEIKQNNRCAITNIPIYIKHPKKNEVTLDDTASLDRIDSKKGYTKDNVQWVALGINYMKMDFEDNDLHKVLKLIKENYIPVSQGG